MLELMRTIAGQADEHVTLLLVCVLLLTLLESSMGIGVAVPGETGVALAAMTVAGNPQLILVTITVAAAGCFVGDHIGFAIGRGVGSRLSRSKLIHRLGTHRWDSARQQVMGRFWTVILARLLSGVKTFVAPAAGTATMSYARFAAISGIAAILWATTWVVNGAAIGPALLKNAEIYTPAVFGALSIGAATMLIIRYRKKARR